MYEDRLKNTFEAFTHSSTGDWSDYEEYCEEKYYPKDSLIKKPDTCEKYFHFLLEGSIGIFLWNEDNYICTGFAFENSFFGDYVSILTGEPSPIEIVALEDSKALRISRNDYLKLGETPEGNQFLRIAAEVTLINLQQHQIDLLSKTAEQRYKEILTNKPVLIERVAQKHLASYLGITPQSLSRIRKHIV